jgi:hypothetical protein
MIANILAELLGLSFPFCLTYVVTTLFYPVAPLIAANDSTVIINEAATNFIKSNGQIAICLIPSLIYCMGRIYFELARFTTRQLQAFSPSSASYLRPILNSAGILGPFFIPTVQNILLDLFNENYGNIYRIVYDLSKPELIKAHELAHKLGKLIIAWFCFFFLFELLLRVVFILLVLLYNSVFGSKKESVAKKDKQE